VLDYNTRLETFPDTLIARNFGFQPVEFFEGDDKDKADIRVSFAPRSPAPEPPASAA